MTSLPDYLAAHRIAFTEIDGLVSGLDADQLATPSLCPDWDVRGCIGHVMGVEKALTGWAPDPEGLCDFDVALEFGAGLAGLAPDEVSTAVQQVIAGTDDLERLAPDIVDAASMTPVGPQTYGSFLQIRVFDMWVRPRYRPAAGHRAARRWAHRGDGLNEVHRSMGYIAGKKIGLEDGMSMTVEVTGGAPRTIHVAVDGRAGLVDSLDEPSLTLTADTETFVMLACGRIDPQERIEAGRISWTGDGSWGDRAARNLRFTM